MYKPKIAVLFPAFLGGGAEAVCLWMLEALKEEYDLTLYTFSHISFSKLNEYYGTQLSEKDVNIMHPFASKKISSVLAQNHSAFTLRQHLLTKQFKKIKKNFDLAISAFNEMDLGQSGIQYINFPMFGRGQETIRRIVGYPNSPLRSAYRNICRVISDFSEERMKNNVTVANSNWTAKVIKQIYGIDAYVIYPPVNSDFPNIAWDARENGFILISRIVPEKKVEKAINILQMLRTKNYDFHLHIISGKCDPKYEKYIQKLRNNNSSWVFLEKGIYRKALCSMLVKHKYGIHVRENEQFGIGVAEMIKAGCIPFVPSEGGQVEIIGNNKQLTFNNEHEAIEKISKVLSSRETQDYLRLFLLERRDLFSENRFKTKIRKLVRGCLEKNKGS